MERYSVGIDLGTSFSCAAVHDAHDDRCSIVPLGDGQDQIPSVVYFGAVETKVGHEAERMLKDVVEADRLFWTPKPRLGTRYEKLLPDGRIVTPVDAAAAIISRLKAAVESHIGEPARSAVLTHPVSFRPGQRDALRESAMLAGFEQVELLHEPVAAAIACIAEIRESENSVALIYDLGGGTFDAAVVNRERHGIRLLLEPRGLARCGGEWFDQAIYDWFVEDLPPLDRVDVHLLRQCRRAKERLTTKARAEINAFAHNRQVHKYLGRGEFEQMIAESVGATVRLAHRLALDAEDSGGSVDTIFLVGGSSLIPLVGREVAAAFGIEPVLTSLASFAVAMGGALSRGTGHGEAAAEAVARAADRPVWASSAGRDEHGRWASLQLLGGDGAMVEQRLRWIPPGRFLMGSLSRETGHVPFDEAPRHEVTIGKGFWMFETACSQALWEAVMGDNPSHARGGALPVEMVDWYLVHEFMARLEPRLKGARLALPTEAQWEYACRAGTSGSFALEPATYAVINYAGTATREVRHGRPNPWGLLQCHGNVHEWCADGRRFYDPRPCTDPVAPQSGQKIVRGGAWNSGLLHTRSAHRMLVSASRAQRDLGFRCVLDSPDP